MTDIGAKVGCIVGMRNLHLGQMRLLIKAAHHFGIFPIASEIFHLWLVMPVPETLSELRLENQIKDTQPILPNESWVCFSKNYMPFLYGMLS